MDAGAYYTHIHSHMMTTISIAHFNHRFTFRAFYSALGPCELKVVSLSPGAPGWRPTKLGCLILFNEPVVVAKNLSQNHA